MCYIQGLQEKVYKADHTAIETRRQAETSLEIKVLRSNTTSGKLSQMLYFIFSRMSR